MGACDGVVGAGGCSAGEECCSRWIMNEWLCCFSSRDERTSCWRDLMEKGMGAGKREMVVEAIC